MGPSTSSIRSGPSTASPCFCRPRESTIRTWTSHWWRRAPTSTRATCAGASSASAAILDQDFFAGLLFVHLTYLLFTTTVHPWYVSMLLMFAILTEFRFVVLWTAMIYLTYAGYTQHTFSENLWLTAIEYSIVLGYLAYEILWERKYFHLRQR